MILHEKISAQLPSWRDRMKSLAKEHADVVVDHVTVGFDARVHADSRIAGKLDVPKQQPGIRQRGDTHIRLFEAVSRRRQIGHQVGDLTHL